MAKLVQKMLVLAVRKLSTCMSQYDVEANACAKKGCLPAPLVDELFCD